MGDHSFIYNSFLGSSWCPSTFVHQLLCILLELLLTANVSSNLCLVFHLTDMLTIYAVAYILWGTDFVNHSILFLCFFNHSHVQAFYTSIIYIQSRKTSISSQEFCKTYQVNYLTIPHSIYKDKYKKVLPSSSRDIDSNLLTAEPGPIGLSCYIFKTKQRLLNDFSS